MRDIFLGVFCSNHNPRGMSEKIVHLFEGQFSSLGKEEPEEDGVGKVADLDVARIEVRVAS
jgi:hypothetical protein